MIVMMRIPPNGGKTETVILHTRRTRLLTPRQIESELSNLLDGKDFEAGIGNLNEDDPAEPLSD